MRSERTINGHPNSAVKQLGHSLTKFCSVFYSKSKSGYSFIKQIFEFWLHARHCSRHAKNVYLAVLVAEH